MTLLPKLTAAFAAVLAVPLLFAPVDLRAEEIGEVSTEFKWIGPNHKIVVEAFDDPDVPGVTCYVSRSKVGGISGGLGLAEETSDATLACRQVGPIKLPADIKKKDGDEVFKERRSLVFKSLQVVRFYDEKRNVLVYLVYSDKIIEGSPKNSVSAVAVAPWPGS
ncbi:CreA family protein [Rhodovibrionaceae bacterium A322]